MAISLQYFVDKVTEPVRVIDVVSQGAEKSKSIEIAEASNLEQLVSYFGERNAEGYLCRFISICQRNSWRPLEITESMFSHLLETCDANPCIVDLASCFYSRGVNVEDAFYIPYTEFKSGPEFEILYSIRYPEFKETRGEWVIRQTGVYQKINFTTCQTVFIVFNPCPDAMAQKHAETWVVMHQEDLQDDPLCLQRVLMDTYLPAWRNYCASLERRFLPIESNAVATFIEELSDSEYRHLTELARLSRHFLQIPVLLAGSIDVLTRLDSVLRSQGDQVGLTCSAKLSIRQFELHRSRCEASSQTAKYLQQRIQTTTQLLANTLSFREQLDAKSQNKSMLQLSKSAIFITTLTLLYLPPSFVATFFGMNFFDLDSDTGRIVGTSMVWIYALCSVVLTATTFILYHILLDGSLLQQIKDHTPILKHLKPRGSTLDSVDLELGSVQG